MYGNPDSGILQIFVSGIRNPGPWNPEYSCRNPESTFHRKRSGIQSLESGNHGVESRIQDCLEFLYMGREIALTFHVGGPGFNSRRWKLFLLFVFSGLKIYR